METKKKEYFKITSRMEQDIREHGEKTGRSPFVLLIGSNILQAYFVKSKHSVF